MTTSSSPDNNRKEAAMPATALTVDQAPPIDEDDESFVGHTSIRLAAILANAHRDRQQAIDPIIEALNLATTEQERAAAAGELIAVALVADQEYNRIVWKARERIAEVPGAARCERTETEILEDMARRPV